MMRICWPILLLSLPACNRGAPQHPEPPVAEEHQHEHENEHEGDAPGGRIEVPEIVRRNLGITFAAVERRRVAATLRVPGQFELLPNGRCEHRAPLAGRVEIRVEPLQALRAGDVLFALDAPQWRAAQRELGELATGIEVTGAKIAAMQPLQRAHHGHEQSLAAAIAVAEARVDGLEATRRDVGGQAQELADARLQLLQMQAQFAEAEEKGAELTATLAQLEADLRAGRDRFDLALLTAATLVGRTGTELQAAAAGSDPPQPLWRALARIEVRAAAAGIADRLPVATGAWVEPGDLVVAVTDLQRVRFRGKALQSDLPHLAGGLPARVLRPLGHSDDPGVPGEVQLGLEADPLQRTIDLFLQPTAAPTWARPGVAAFLEIETASSAADELAIPLAAVLQDGTQRVFFRRDPTDPDRVLRVEADLGVDDGRWVEVKSGLRDGDSVVVAGAYELVLATSGRTRRAGHFHANGEFHEDEHR